MSKHVANLFENLKITKEEIEIIFKIARRAYDILEKNQPDEARQIKPLTIVMDLELVHSQTPLRLQELLDASPFDFTHDVFGIIEHMDRDLGRMVGPFSPRFAVH